VMPGGRSVWSRVTSTGLDWRRVMNGAGFALLVVADDDIGEAGAVLGVGALTGGFPGGFEPGLAKTGEPEPTDNAPATPTAKARDCIKLLTRPCISQSAYRRATHPFRWTSRDVSA